jgi:DNA invertase Pin-like site-specific DNA recombinase
MIIVGYTRRSQGDADALGLRAQERKIRDAYPGAHVAQEVASGGRADNREVLQGILHDLRRGDTLVVTRLDRLVRSSGDFADITRDALRRGWNLVVMDLGFDLSSPMGQAMATVTAAFAQLERDLMSHRMKEALAEKHARGEDPRRISDKFKRRVVRLHRAGKSQRAIASQIGTHKETVARILRAEVGDARS